MASNRDRAGAGPPVLLRRAILERPGDDAQRRYTLVVDRNRPGEFRPALLSHRQRAGLADVWDHQGVRDNARLAGFLRSLLGQKAAVDRERVAGDHRRGGACQVKDRPGDLVGCSEPFERGQRGDAFDDTGLVEQRAVKLVRTQVGATALTRIPEGAHSTASALVILTTPAFVA